MGTVERSIPGEPGDAPNWPICARRGLDARAQGAANIRRYAPSAISESLGRYSAALQTATVAPLAKLRFARPPAGGSPMLQVRCHREQDDAEGPDLLLGVWDDGIDPRARRSLCRRQACPSCPGASMCVPECPGCRQQASARVFNKSLRCAGPACHGEPARVAEGSANFLRPERRSTDGQPILKATSD